MIHWIILIKQSVLSLVVPNAIVLDLIDLVSITLTSMITILTILTFIDTFTLEHI